MCPNQCVRIGTFALLNHFSDLVIILVLDDLKGKSAGGAEFRKIAVIHLLRRLAGAGTIKRWLLMCAGDVTSRARNDMKPTWLYHGWP